MSGFIKGIAVGLASFALGFAVLSVVLEPENGPDMHATAPEAAPDIAPEPAPDMPDDAPGDAPDDAREADTAVEDVSEAGAAEDTTLMPEAAAGPAEEAGADGAPADGLNEGVAEAVDEAVAGDDEAADATEAPSSLVEPAEAGVSVEVEISTEHPARTEPDAPDAEQTPPAPEASTEDQALPETEALAESDTPPEPELPAGTEPLDETEISPRPDTASETEAEAAPVVPPVLRAVPASPGLDREVEGVTVGRLPSIAPTGDDAAPDAAAQREDDTAGTTEGDTPATSPEPEPQPARQRYAADYEPAPGPLFAVILLDSPADPAAEAAIVALPMPVAVALDPHDPDATRRAQVYRDAGHEVLILAAGLPQGATASDLDVTFEAWFRALPEAVALIDPAEGGFQGNRGMAQAIMPYLADDGHGLITHERGLNPAQQSANSAGVANAAVFRIIDSDDENQFTIRRYLDRATFRAQQEGWVVVMGRAGHPETIDGLIGWRMEGRAGQVAIVPVSALLRLP